MAHHTEPVVVGANQEVVEVASVKDRVAMMWGEEIARTLAGEGLLAPDDSNSIVNDVQPIRWRIYAKADLRHTNWAIPPGAKRGVWNPAPHPMKAMLKRWVHNVNFLLSERAGMGTGYARKDYYERMADEILGWNTYDLAREATAKSQARMLRNLGFDVRVVGLATIECAEVPI